MRQPLFGIGQRVMQDGGCELGIDLPRRVFSNRWSRVPQRVGSPSGSQKKGFTQCLSRISATSAGTAQAGIIGHAHRDPRQIIQRLGPRDAAVRRAQQSVVDDAPPPA